MVVLFADSCFLIGLNDRKDQYHKVSIKIWDRLNKDDIIKESMDVVVTDYVLVEVFQGLQSHAGFKIATKAYKEMNENCKVQKVTESKIQKAITEKLRPFLNHRTNQPPIGLVDAVSLVTMDNLNIQRIISFDGGFDKFPLTKRIFDESSLTGFQATTQVRNFRR
ncbi:MAG: hypothetical protein CHKLHMKO_00513 [Candidatus Argoarchaeum ethanivorans]|uniref:PIN domain-containing protein n=1 Tax=Candidatus Argoarchaeum ethanivorans TaxID=2608793 RepID=A0A811TD16_9EURY|nr:MAG: hypothetical protein CHKLHMKO_00513 [Candidatus Argoarchaeum ethanivorans]